MMLRNKREKPVRVSSMLSKYEFDKKTLYLPLPRESLESPALTPRFSMHFPISTSSAPPPSDRHIIPKDMRFWSVRCRQRIVADTCFVPYSPGGKSLDSLS